MNDETTPEAPEAAPAPQPPTMEPPPPPPAYVPAPAVAAAPKPGSKRPVILIGVIVVFLAVVLFMVKDAGKADELKVGECFDVPTTATFGTVTHHPCTEAHTAEVFHVAEFTGSDMNTPLTFVIEGFVSTTCGPVFTSYTGQPFDSTSALELGYLSPDDDGWKGGDRTITCFAENRDGSPLTQSVKGKLQ